MRRGIITSFAVVLVFTSSLGIVAACTPEPTAVPPDAGPTPPSRYATGPQPLDSLELWLDEVATGFDQPVLVTDAGDRSGRLFVVEQGGRIRVIRDGEVSPGDFLDLRGRVSTGGERGLLGLAFAPDFATSGAFYVDYTDTRGDTVVARCVANDPASDTPKVAGPDAVLRIEQPYANHNGGHIAFGPDGRLWVGMGDGGSGGDPQGNAQDPESLLGKMLALDVGAVRPEPRIVIAGVRNPWRYSFDRANGDLWIADVGQNAWEEIDLLPKGTYEGADLGWNLWEGSHPYPADAKPARDGFVFPVAEYGHDAGRSVTGGYVYRGERYPRMTGAYLYADFEAGWVAALRAEADTATGEPRTTEQRVMLEDVGNPSSFGEDEDGELYLCEYGRGTVYAIGAK